MNVVLLRRPLPALLMAVAMLFGPGPSPVSAAQEDLPAQGAGPVQATLDAVVDELGLRRAVNEQRLGLALVRLDGGDFDGLGLLNGHRMFYAASLPKIAILYGAAVSLDQGRFELDQYLHDDLVAMIRRSCNACATRVLGLVGREWLLELLQDGPHRLYDPELRGGLWVGKDYAKRAAYRRDPLAGTSHGATAWQAARFYYLLFQGTLASPEQTRLMQEALADPAIQHKFVKGLEGQQVERLYRKSGTWRRYHSDSVLVQAEGGSYILVGLSRDAAGGEWLERLAAAVHQRMITAEP